jgi:hypothetical protein
VVTVIGQSNKTELNNSRRIILRRNYLALKTFGRKSGIFYFFVTVMGRILQRNCLNAPSPANLGEQLHYSYTTRYSIIIAK